MNIPVLNNRERIKKVFDGFLTSQKTRPIFGFGHVRLCCEHWHEGPGTQRQRTFFYSLFKQAPSQKSNNPKFAVPVKCCLRSAGKKRYVIESRSLKSKVEQNYVQTAEDTTGIQSLFSLTIA